MITGENNSADCPEGSYYLYNIRQPVKQNVPSVIYVKYTLMPLKNTKLNT